MYVERRMFIAGTAALTAVGPATGTAGANGKYGLISRMTAQAGKRDVITSLLVENVASMPGCLSYVVAHDLLNAEVIWITEVWASKDAHAASLGLPSVRRAIQEARPLIAGVDRIAETLPIGSADLPTDG